MWRKVIWTFIWEKLVCVAFLVNIISCVGLLWLCTRGERNKNRKIDEKLIEYSTKAIK